MIIVRKLSSWETISKYLSNACATIFTAIAQHDLEIDIQVIIPHIITAEKIPTQARMSVALIPQMVI